MTTDDAFRRAYMQAPTPRGLRCEHSTIHSYGPAIRCPNAAEFEIHCDDSTHVVCGACLPGVLQAPHHYVVHRLPRCAESESDEPGVVW